MASKCRAKKKRSCKGRTSSGRIKKGYKLTRSGVKKTSRKRR
ncbi:MAG: hypothetical protein ACYS1A_16830 [Planctomycetota bacterium]